MQCLLCVLSMSITLRLTHSLCSLVELVRCSPRTDGDDNDVAKASVARMADMNGSQWQSEGWQDGEQ